MLELNTNLVFFKDLQKNSESDQVIIKNRIDKLVVLILIMFFIFSFSLKYALAANALFQFNQTQTANITGNASTTDQAIINTTLNTNGDGSTWNVTEAGFVTNITNVTRGFYIATAAEDSVNISIPNSNMNQTFYLAWFSTAAGTQDDWSWTAQLINNGDNTTNTIHFERNATGNIATNISYEVITTKNIFVQHGTVVMNSGTGSTTASLGSAVNLSSSLVIIHTRCAAGTCSNNNYANEVFVSANLTDTTTVSFQRASNANTRINISYQVVNFTDGTWVQNKQINMSSGTTASVSMTSVDTTRSFVYHSYQANYYGMSYATNYVNLVDATHTSITRASSSSSYWIYAQVFAIQVPSGLSFTVQSATVSPASTDNYDSQAVTSVDMTRSLIVYSEYGESGAGTGNAYPRPFWAVKLTNSALIEWWRGYNGQAGNIRWYLIEYPITTTTNYQLSVEHNATMSYYGTLSNVNASINFTSTVDDLYNMTIYDFTNSIWNVTVCQNQSVTANTYYTLWCNVTSNPTNYISSDNKIRVRLNSTIDLDQGTLKEEYVQYYINSNVGYLEVNLTLPSTDATSNELQNYTFLVNATVFCRSYPCGYINGTVMYNSSHPFPDTAISTTQGATPFFIQEASPSSMKACPNNPLNVGDFCNLTWTINATGNIGTNWKIGVLFNSSYNGVQSNNTLNATVSITPCTQDFSINWNSIKFGLLNPSSNQNPAPGNAGNQYNITVNLGSCNLDFYINGTDLVNTTFNSRIKVGNLTWSNKSNTYSQSYNLSSNVNILKLNVPQSIIFTSWYWINVPAVYAGYYNGSMYIFGVKNGASPP